MRKGTFWAITGLMALFGVQASAESLAQYVSACRTQLNIPSNVTIDNMDCYDGDLFATGGDINDRLGYKKVTDQVDLTFACRWVFGDKSARQTAVSVELLMHNRQNGNTCFFSAIGSFPGDQQVGPPSIIVSPTASNAASYWAAPQELDTRVRCIGCHVSGVYIATPRITPYLAKFGLLNNGHDTLSNVTSADFMSGNPGVHVKYHAVVTPPPAVSNFANWNSLKQSYVDPSAGCSLGCHTIGSLSPQPDITVLRKGPTTVLPNVSSILSMISDANAMGPSQYDSHYRWVNLDIPDDGVESENFVAARNATSLAVPNLVLQDGSACPATSVPGDLEAHAVGVNVENSFSFTQVTWLTEKLRSFNLKDGLVCLNSDQDPGVSCRDFDVSYLCNDGTWTNFFNHNVNSGLGDDHEERSFSNSAIVAACGGKQPVGIKARIFLNVRGGQSPQTVIGPNDRLGRFSQYGLTCNSSDQPDGKCSNYVVRYQVCATPPAITYKHLTNVFTGKQLTASGGANNALTKGQPYNPTWNTQQWALEPVKNTEYVRLKNTGTNTYLNVLSSAESATVVTSTSSTAAGEMWTVEAVTYSNDFRLKNLATGKYLTSQDPGLTSDPNYLVIYSQGKNAGWTSQRWVIN